MPAAPSRTLCTAPLTLPRHRAPAAPQMGQYGFLSTVFDAFRRHKISVDVVATSEASRVPGGHSRLGLPHSRPAREHAGCAHAHAHVG
jgi:hypothetical protein